MIVSISQPAYLPWLGYFDRIYKSSLHIVLDDVKLERSSKTRFTNRNKIKTLEGFSWLTVPVFKAGQDQPYIHQVCVQNDSKWSKKHFGTLLGSYNKSNYFLEHRDWFNDFYKKEWKFLGSLLEESTDYLMKVLGISTPTLKSSEIDVNGQKSDYILNLCIEVDATTYLSGPFGRDYLDLKKFDKAGIEVEFHDYEHPEYHQLYGNFLTYMSVIDLIFNEGPRSLEILTVGLEQ